MNETLLGVVLGVAGIVSVGGLMFMNTVMQQSFKNGRSSRH